MYEFKEEFKTGIDQIDQEHKRLFEIADQIYELKNKEFVHDKYDEIRSILEELRDYTDTHFAHEEAYMESIGYKNMFMQEVQHDACADRWRSGIWIQLMSIRRKRLMRSCRS